MKVWLGSPTRWWHPSSILLPFKWALNISDDDYYGFEDSVQSRFKDTRIGKWLQYMSYRSNSRRYIKIDRWDIWDAQSDLAFIIAPLLQKFRADMRGIPYTNRVDAPHIDTEDGHDAARWEWILDEMIFAFKAINDPRRENQFYSGELSWHFETVELDGQTFREFKEDSKSTFEIDREGQKAYEERVANGLRLFGVYYQSLWA
jgi:hypothetical protein